MADYRSNIKDEVEVTPYRKIQNGSITGDMVKDRTITRNKLAEGVIPPINNKHNYSTTEQVVGTWIDGKTLYEKTMVFTSVPEHTYTELYTFTNENIVSIECIVTWLTGVKIFGNFNNDGVIVASDISVNNAYRLWWKHPDTGLDNAVVIFRYTKTTDVPNA